jgi:hypothetical protein
VKSITDQEVIMTNNNSQSTPAGDVGLWQVRLAEATLEIEEIDREIRDNAFFDPELEGRRRQANWHAFGITLRLSDAIRSEQRSDIHAEE